MHYERKDLLEVINTHLKATYDQLFNISHLAFISYGDKTMDEAYQELCQLGDATLKTYHKLEALKKSLK